MKTGTIQEKVDLITHSSTKDSILYSLVQPGNLFFETAHGFIAYRISKGRMIAMGPAVTQRPEDTPELVSQFITHCEKKGKPFDFFYIQEDYAHVLQEIDPALIAQGIGVETILRLDSRSMAALHEIKEVASALSKFTKHGGKVVSAAFDHNPHIAETIQRITEDWLTQKKSNFEITFVCRPLQLGEHDDHVRFYTLSIDPSRLYPHQSIQDDRTFGYVVLDPYAFNTMSGKPDCFLINMIRFQKTKNWGIYYAVACLLAETLAKEGIQELSLGLSPLQSVSNTSQLKRSDLFEKLMTGFIAPFGEYAYNFNNLRSLKSVFLNHPDPPAYETQRYHVTRSKGFFRILHSQIATINACGLDVGLTSYAQIVKFLLSKATRKQKKERSLESDQRLG